MKFPNHLIRRPKLTGFTLIELLVVIIIIAALAALVVPNVGSFGRSTDMAVSAKTQADIANNIQQFNLLQKRYPQGMDSLITTGAAPTIYGSDVTSADNQTRGLPYGGADGTRLEAQLSIFAVPVSPTVEPTVANPDYRRSITRAGFDWVYDHDTAVINSNLSNTTVRGLINAAAPAGPGGIALVEPAAANYRVAQVTGAALLAKLVPQGLRAGELVIAFGYGNKSTAISKTTTTVPLYPGADKTYYGRYIVYFKIYATGERASLVGVSDSYGRTPDYTQQQFNESLPDGARQG
jgi:prepilin-type N-terminal cleavage/methylation domain-containing protein